MPEYRYHSRGGTVPTDMPLATREQVAEAFCVMAGVVNTNVFQFSVATDCFCVVGDQFPKMPSFHWDRQAWEFIAEAVQEKLDREVEIQQRIREAVNERTKELLE